MHKGDALQLEVPAETSAATATTCMEPPLCRTGRVWRDFGSNRHQEGKALPRHGPVSSQLP